MGRLTDQTRAQKETTIRAAMDRLLRGEIPPGGKCDVKVRHLQQRLSTAEQENAGLTAFRTQAVSQLAAHHDEITQLRATLTSANNVRGLSSSRDRASARP